MMDRPWFDQDSGTLLLDEYLLEMDYYQRIVEDGTITDDELVEQTQRVASLLRRLEEALSPHRRRNRGCGDAGVVRVVNQKSGANNPMDTDENKERTTPGEREEVRSTGSGGERTKGRASRPDRGSTRGTSGAVAAATGAARSLLQLTPAGDAAQAAIKDNRRPPPSGRRVWELSGLLRCCRCGYMMNAQTTTGGSSREHIYFYYRCGGRYRSRNGCDHTKQHRAEEADVKIWRYVRDLMAKPEELRTDLERMIELKRKETRGDPEREAKTWLDKLAEVERQRARAQDMAIQGLLSYDELRVKLASLEETREAAEQELATLKNQREHIAELERGKEAVLEHYATIAPEALDSLASKERRHLYKLLQLKALQHPDGSMEFEVSGLPGPELVQPKILEHVFPSSRSLARSATLARPRLARH